jgi:tRNA 2-thiouridine synthesizing protein A
VAQNNWSLSVGKPVFTAAKKGTSSVSAADLDLDITSEVCPMTFVRTKLALERMAVGQVMNIKLRDGEPRHNVPRALRDHGHEILSLQRLDAELFELVVRKLR